MRLHVELLLVCAAFRIATTRLLYAISGPLLPAVRLHQVLKQLRRTDRDKTLLPRLLPVLALGLAVNRLGGVVGYTLGTGGG